MEDRQTAPKKYYRVLDCEYDEDKKLYSTEKTPKKKEGLIKRLFGRIKPSL